MVEEVKKSLMAKYFQLSKVLAWLFLVGFLLLLPYIYYRMEIVNDGMMNVRYFKYFIICSVGIIFWILVLNLKKEIRANIVMVTVSFVVGLYFMETLLEMRPGEYGSRSGYQAVQDLRDEGVDAYPAVGFSHLTTVGGLQGTGTELLYSLGGVSGISGKITVFCDKGGEWITYPADRYGFNNPDSVWDQGQVEWLLAGDSFTHGVCVEPDNNIAGQIRSMTRESVVNLGVHGSGPLVELAALKEYAESVRPKKVFWVYYEGNDLIMELPYEKGVPLLMQYLERGFSQHLIHRQKEIDDGLIEFIEEAEIMWKTNAFNQKTRWFRLFAVRGLLSFDFSGYTVEPVVDPLFGGILTKAKDRTEAWGGKFYFVYLPEFSRYQTNVDHNLFRKRAEVIDLVEGLNIPVIDIHQEVFSNHADPLSLFPLRRNGHYNSDGYSEVAEEIVAGVRD